LKFLKTKCQRLWRQKFWWTSLIPRAWSSEDQGKCSLILIKLRWSSNWLEVKEESTSDLQIVHRTEHSYKAVTFGSAKSTVRRWVVNKSISLSHNGYIIVPDYKRDLKERWRLGRFCTHKRWIARKLQSFLHSLSFIVVYTSACIEAIYL
jgi:hypothetical protein